MFAYIIHKTLLKALSRIFERGVVARRVKYQPALKTESPFVISVGNITLGGSGKTEFVYYLAEQFVRQNRVVYIITRGYKGRDGYGEVDSVQPKLFGDEPVMLFERLHKLGVRVLKARKKYKAFNKYAFPPDAVIIADDAFQHFKLKRKIDYVCVNSVNPFGNGELFPYGILREPISHLCFADRLVLTNYALANEGEKNFVREALTKMGFEKVTVMDYQIAGFWQGATHTYLAPREIKRKRVFAFAGIGNPIGFLRLLRKSGLKVVGATFFEDHYSYKARDILNLQKLAVEKGADIIATTEKDYTKLRDFRFAQQLYCVKLDLKVMEEYEL